MIVHQKMLKGFVKHVKQKEPHFQKHRLVKTVRRILQFLQEDIIVGAVIRACVRFVHQKMLKGIV